MGRKGNATAAEVSLSIRQSVVLTGGAVAIQALSKDELCNLQRQLHLGDNWGVIDIPVDWLPPGICQTLGTRQIDIRKHIFSDGLEEVEIEACVLSITRYALICFMVPMIASTVGVIFLAPTTISSALKTLCKIAKKALLKSNTGNDQIFSRIGSTDFPEKGLSSKFRAEFNRIIQLTRRGLWSDCPNFDVDRAVEVPRKGVSENAASAEDLTVPFLPFNDVFTSEAGWRMAWITESLGPLLLTCAEGLIGVYASLTSTSSDSHAFESKCSCAAIDYLSTYQWKNSKGEILSELPFDISVKTRGPGSPFDWPPKFHGELKALITLLQTSHLFIFLLCTGGRISEALSLQEGCVVKAKDGTATINGRTYKLVFANEGQARDWPLPRLGVLAIHQQERLVRLSSLLKLGDSGADDDDSVSEFDDDIEADDTISKPLWRRVGTGKRITGDYNGMLVGAVEVLGLKSILGTDRPHAHRFRKTIARLVALAIVDSPKILMDLFGHKTIEMTLSYILTDPNIRAEMEEVLKAQTIMLAEDAIVNAKDYGGPAAHRIRDAKRKEEVRLGREFGAQDIKSLAETFTFSGKFWQLVRPGVICTKLSQQAGPCNQQVGKPEPSRCRSLCDFRLETAALRDDVDRAIAQAVHFLAKAQEDDDVIASEMWEGQILTNLNRFPDLRAKWEKIPEVSRLLSPSLEGNHD